VGGAGFCLNPPAPRAAPPPGAVVCLPPGARAFEERDHRKDASYSYETPPKQLPPDIERRLEADAAAWAYWRAQPASYRRAAIHWLLDAKREETRERRLTALIEDSAAGRPIKPFSYFRQSDRPG
jgi:hypothetical protein